MAEQVPISPRKPPVPRPRSEDAPALDIVAHPNSLPPPPRRETYVIQVPKDQIYRVPPPENARIAEKYRDQNQSRRGSPCLSCLSYLKWPLIVVLILIVLVAIGAIAFFATVAPATPVFALTDLAVKGKTEYDLTVTVRNPSKKMGFAYGGGGKATLTHNGENIATGRTPIFFQDARNTTNMILALRGSKGKSPVKGSKDSVELGFAMKATVNPRIGELELWPMDMEVSCNVLVKGLAKKPRIVSQDCKSKLHT